MLTVFVCSSLGNFDINQPQDRMPEAMIKAFGILKGAAATVNMGYGLGKFSTKRIADFWSIVLTELFVCAKIPRSVRPSSRLLLRSRRASCSTISLSLSGKPVPVLSPT